MQNHPFRKEMPMLNGAFILITEDNEFRMCHWVTGFEIKDPATGQPVLPPVEHFLQRSKLSPRSVRCLV